MSRERYSSVSFPAGDREPVSANDLLMPPAPSVTPRSVTRDEQELVAAVRRDDDRAFEELYERYRKRVQAYVLGMVGDHARAEDVTQEVFISALRRMRDTERPIAFKPWIYAIAKNACIDHFRRSRRAEEVPLETDDGVSHADRGALTLSSTPDLQVQRKLQLDDLRGAFGGLSESHHEILVLRELEGLSYKEIGERMGMSRPVVESTLFRARRRLTEEYDELVSGRRCERVMAADQRRQRGIAARARPPRASPDGQTSVALPALPAPRAAPRPRRLVLQDAIVPQDRRAVPAAVPGRPRISGPLEGCCERARTPLARVHALGRRAVADWRPRRTGTRARPGRCGACGARHSRRRRRPGRRRPRPRPPRRRCSAGRQRTRAPPTAPRRSIARARPSAGRRRASRGPARVPGPRPAAVCPGFADRARASPAVRPRDRREAPPRPAGRGPLRPAGRGPLRPAGRAPPPPARPRLRRAPAARARRRSIPSRPSAGCCPPSATHPTRSRSCTSSCLRCHRCRCRACRSCRDLVHSLRCRSPSSRRYRRRTSRPRRSCRPFRTRRRSYLRCRSRLK